MTQRTYLIARHTVLLSYSSTELDVDSLLPGLKPFLADETDCAGECLFTLNVDCNLQPARERTRLKTFDTGNGDTTVFTLPDGGYQFIIRDILGRECALLIADADFTCCRCAIKGKATQQAYGLSSVMMMCYAYSASRFDTLLIHASAIKVGRYAYAFTAKSGTGKSTHTAMWMRSIPGAELLNDDNPIIRIRDGQAKIYGSPWSGKTPCYRRRQARLGAIVSINRAKSNSIEPLGPVSSLATLMEGCSTMMWDTRIYNRMLDTLSTLIATTPIFKLHCLPDEEAAAVCYAAVAKEVQ